MSGFKRVRGAYRYLKFNFVKERTKYVNVMGVMSVEHYVSGFESGGGKTDASINGWRPRASSKGAGRAILVKAGNLRNSIRVTRRGRTSVTIGSEGIPYADRHNKGLSGMPQREFIGDSRELENEIEKYLDSVIIPNL